MFLFYRGSECENGVTETAVSTDTQKLFSFIRSCANLPKVHVLSLFDCCSREFAGAEEISEKLGTSANVAIIYRESGVCAGQYGTNMAERFFNHLKVERSGRQHGLTVFPTDLDSFNPPVKYLSKGWQADASSANGRNLNVQVGSDGNAPSDAIQSNSAEESKETKLSDKEFYEQSSRKFFKALGRKAGKVIKYAMLIRFAIVLLMNKLNLFKAIKGIKPVLLLGLGCGTFNIFHHLIRRFFALKRLSSPASAQRSFWMS